MSLGYVTSAGVGFITTLVISALIILTQGWHGRWTYDVNNGVQKFHTQPTPRIGGLAILIGVFISIIKANQYLTVLTLLLLLSSLIPFFVGFIEDITKSVSVRDRLLATMAASLTLIAWTGIYLNRLDILIVDDWMSWWPLGVLITMVAVSGVTNAINILDGFNGLASGTSVIILTIFAYMAYQAGDAELLSLCTLLAGVILGFMLLNYPFGKIFLGDAGAYFIGFLIGWIAILLPYRHEYISPWASLLVCAYPVTEVLYSIFRRMRARSKLGQPDSQHLHSLIKKKLVRRLMFLSPRTRNSLVAPCVWLSSACVGLLAACYASDVLVLVGFYAAFVLWYHISYLFLATLQDMN